MYKKRPGATKQPRQWTKIVQDEIKDVPLMQWEHCNYTKSWLLQMFTFKWKINETKGGETTESPLNSWLHLTAVHRLCGDHRVNTRSRSLHVTGHQVYTDIIYSVMSPQWIMPSCISIMEVWKYKYVKCALQSSSVHSSAHWHRSSLISHRLVDLLREC